METITQTSQENKPELKEASQRVEDSIANLVNQEGISKLEAAERIYKPYQVEGMQVTKQEYFFIKALALVVDLEKTRNQVSKLERDAERYGLNTKNWQEAVNDNKYLVAA
jgi:dTDP-4-dehydrorhamnose reductase